MPPAPISITTVGALPSSPVQCRCMLEPPTSTISVDGGYHICMRRSWWPRIGRSRPQATRRRPTRRPLRGRAWSTSEADPPARAGLRVADPFRSASYRVSLLKERGGQPRRVAPSPSEIPLPSRNASSISPYADERIAQMRYLEVFIVGFFANFVERRKGEVHGGAVNVRIGPPR